MQTTISNLTKMAESYPNGKKTLWEKEKLLVTSNFSFSHSVFKRLVSQERQKVSLSGNGLSLTFTFIYLINFVVIKKILFTLLLKEISVTSFPISVSKQISIKMKNPEPLRYYVRHQLFDFIFFTFINEEYFNSSYYSYKVIQLSVR